jgi:signal transduction histidine kinase
MRINSIRLRVLAVACASIVATLAVAGVSLVLIFERQVLRYVEHDLGIRWTELAAAVGAASPEELEASLRLTDPRYQRPYGGAYWQVSEHGKALLRSRSLWDNELSPPPAVDANPAEPFEVQGPSGTWLYVVEQDVTIESGTGQRTLSLAVALDKAQVVERRQAFSRDVLRILVLLAAVLVLFAWLQLWLGLRPLWQVGEQLNAVQTGQLRRMTQGFPKEIASLVDSINDLLDRQETLVRKARDRAGALAHGLKTPLTILAGEVRRIEQQGLREEASRVQEQLGLIRGHLDRELARSRTSGASVGCGAYTDVETTINRILKLMQHMPRGDVLRWDTKIPPNLRINMDPNDFGEVMGNLLDNARKWAKASVEVQVTLSEGKARVCVKDDGPGFAGRGGNVPPERGLPETNDLTSTGLGLSIVEDVLSEYDTAPVIQRTGQASVSFEVLTCSERLSSSRLRTH